MFSWSPKPEAAAKGVLCKKLFLEISQNSLEHACARASFLIKLRASDCNFIKKETLAQAFSFEFCESSKGLVTQFCYNWRYGGIITVTYVYNSLLFSIIFGLHLSIISLKFRNKIKLKKLNYKTFYLFITKELVAHHRKVRQPESQSNIFSKRKDQVKKLLACKITYVTIS